MTYTQSKEINLMKKEHITSKFCKNKSGNIALTFSLMLLPVMLSVGATIDYNRGIRANTLIQQSADAAVLTALNELEKGETRQEARKAGRRAFRFNLPDEPKYKKFTPKFDIDTTLFHNTVTVTVEDEIPNAFLSIAGIDTFPINVEARSFITTPRQEISMVLDVSQSMVGNNRLTNMVAAAKDFITTLSPFETGSGYRVINIVPFANKVNLGLGYSHWIDPTATAAPFDGCIELDTNHRFLMDNIPSNAPGAMIPYRNTIRDNSGNPSIPDTPRCVSANSEVSLFGTDAATLISKVDSFDIGYGTGTDEALLWGWRTLSPKWRPHFNGSKTYPRDYNVRNQKIIVLLTDGQIFRQELNPPYPAVTDKHKRINDADADFNRICDDIDDNTDIRVFTIGFDLGAAEPALRTALQDCASNGGSYFDASTTDIGDTFKTIASEIQSLRLVR